MVHQSALRLFCSHGSALLFIALHPDCTVHDLAEALVLTRRRVWALVSDLKRGDLISTRREGRRHHYSINEDAPIPDPILSHLTLGRISQTLLT